MFARHYDQDLKIFLIIWLLKVHTVKSHVDNYLKLSND